MIDLLPTCLERACCLICSLQRVDGRIRERAIFLHRAIIFVLAVIFCVRSLALFASMSATVLYSAIASQEISVTVGFTIVRGPCLCYEMFVRCLIAMQLLVYSMRMFRRTMDAAQELTAATFLELKCDGRARILCDSTLHV